MKKTWIILSILLVAAISVFVIFKMQNKTYTVTFDTQGGNLISSVEVKKNEVVARPNNPTKEGYTFLEWRLDDEIYDFNQKITKDITIVATWKKDSSRVAYTIKFDTDGGNTLSNMIVSDGKITSLPKPVKEGYVFSGWYLNDKKIEVGEIITKNETLKAKWELEKNDEVAVTLFTVTFNTDGGTKISKQSIAKNNKVKKPSNPTKKGYTFVEWLYNGKTYDFNQKVTKDMTLTAKWKENDNTNNTTTTTTVKKVTYTVTFNPNGGNAIDKQIIESQTKVTKPTDPVRENYKFLGWYLNNQLFDFSSLITEDITLIAKWEYIPKLSYKIEEVPGSIVGQAVVYVLKDGVTCEGYADITTQKGTQKVLIPKEGLNINKNKIVKIENISI